MRFLLDTNTIVGLLNDATSAAARRIRREQPSDVAISAVVMHELFYGAYKSHVVGNVAVINALQFSVIDFGKDDARRAGELRAFLAARGTPIGPYDVLIAGHAAARNLILVTNNTSEFSRVPGLRIADWHA